MKQHQ